METIRGTIDNEIELRFTANGKAIATFQLVDNPEAKQPKFTKVVIWEELAELCDMKLQKCDIVYLKGYYKNRSWEKQNGETVTVTEFIVKDVWLVSPDSSSPVNINSLE